MHIQLDSWTHDKTLFFTAGNLPTQQAYALSSEDVVDAFVVSVLRSERVLLAASFFFESAATRNLVRQFPSIWQWELASPLFYINRTYPSFTDHGIGKVDKSPSSFDPYSDPARVRRRGQVLDSLGLVGLRADVDISAALADAWVRSSLSSEAGSVGAILRAEVMPDMVEAATAVCVGLAANRERDFIWPAIEGEIRTTGVLAPLYNHLRRALADLYAEIMSIALGAVETTPALALSSSPLSERGVGHLGRFSTVLRRVGINPRAVRGDSPLKQLLQLDELALLRALDDEVLDAALGAQQDADELWRAIALTEDLPGPRPQLTDIDIRRALVSACDVVGVTPTDGLSTKVDAVERFYNGTFLRHFRSRVEEILEGRLHCDGSPAPRSTLNVQQVLLFVSADPNLGAPAMRLETDRELKVIDGALRSLGDRSALRLETIPSLEAADIQPALLLHKPTYFHFSGHGDANGRIFVQDAAGGRAEVRIDVLLDALAMLTPAVECAVFHSCYSQSALELIGSATVKHLILANDKVPEKDAREFSAGFYLSLAAGFSVPQSFKLGLNSLLLKGCAADRLQLFELVPERAPSERAHEPLHIGNYRLVSQFGS